MEGRLSPFTDEESKFITELEKADGFRLGCAVQIEGDALIFIPEESRAGKQVVRKAATQRAIQLKPAIQLYYVELSPPSLRDPRGDLDRLKEGLRERYHLLSLDIDYLGLLTLPGVLRQATGKSPWRSGWRKRFWT